MFWGKLVFQDSISGLMLSIESFYNYIVFFLLMIIFLVMFIFGFMLSSNFINFFKYENMELEFFWTLFPCLMLFFMGVPSLGLLYKMESVFIPSVTIHVIGHQWYWSYEYNDFKNLSFDSFMLGLDYLNSGMNRLLEVDNRLVLPFKSVIRFLVSSADVLHSFALPSLGIKVDANPGRVNQVFSLSDFPQVVYGQCSEICGANHSFMPIVLEFSSFFLFKNWVMTQS